MKNIFQHPIGTLRTIGQRHRTVLDWIIDGTMIGILAVLIFILLRIS